MPLGNHALHQLRIRLGPDAGHAKGRFDPLVAEKIEDLRGVAGVGAGVKGQRDLEAAVRTPIDDRAEPRAGIGRRWWSHDVGGRCGQHHLPRLRRLSIGSETGAAPAGTSWVNAAVSDDESTSGAAGSSVSAARRDLRCRVDHGRLHLDTGRGRLRSHDDRSRGLWGSGVRRRLDRRDDLGGRIGGNGCDDRGSPRRAAA